MPTNPLDVLHESYIKSQNVQGLGTLTGLTNILKGAQKPLASDVGTARIPLSVLPPGTKPGDRISLTITGVDGINGTATVMADNPTNAVAPEPEKQDAIDTGLSMGPMSDLKSYLFKKTQEQETA